MKIKQLFLGMTVVVLSCCHQTAPQNDTETNAAYPDIQIVAAMKNVMWKGELGSRIDLDTLSDKVGLYGLGPVSYLTGELLINNGKSYVSSVTSDSTMKVEKRYDVSAPFFVYGNVTEWEKIELSPSIKTIKDLEKYLDEATSEFKRPFVFKVIGSVASATIHVQNLPAGTKVSSPDEAHQGQVNYELGHENVEIVGFFSTEHQGVFTHHDSFLHLHLITKDERMMGHLDAVEIKAMQLYLPKR